jgi:hypothetical protein
MKKRKPSKLHLSRETLRSLDTQELSMAAGGKTSEYASECDTCSCGGGTCGDNTRSCVTCERICGGGDLE